MAEQRVTREARLRWVPISLMRYSPMISQREKINWNRVDRMAAEADLEQLGKPVVNHRGDHYNVIDGMHRVEMLKKIGYGDQQVQCECYFDLTDEEEAEVFLRRNDVLPVSALDRFLVGVSAKRTAETDVERIVRTNGLFVGRKNQDGLSCVGTLMKIYRRSDPKTLARTLRVARDSYGDAGMEAAVLDGLALFCQRFDGQVKDDALVSRLSSVRGGVDGLKGRARAAYKQHLGPLPHCVAAATVEIVNGGRGGKKLPVWWKTT